ncbi:MAG: hypothetical protein HY873_11075 [Chloroflexi bacterium]|nr:hypothetical protein [Chloroflexota bacterium]
MMIGVVDPEHGVIPGATGEGVWRPANRLVVGMSNLDMARFPVGTLVPVKVTKGDVVLLDTIGSVVDMPAESGPVGYITGGIEVDVREAALVPSFNEIIGATVEVGTATGPCTADAVTCIHWSGVFAQEPPEPEAPLAGIAELRTGKRFRIEIANIDLARFPEGTLFNVEVSNGATAPAFSGNVPLQALAAEIGPGGHLTGVLLVEKLGSMPHLAQLNAAFVRITGPCIDAGALCPQWQGQFESLPFVVGSPTNEPDLSRVFSSSDHGDPRTPLVEAFVGENIRLRVGQAVGDSRATTFMLHGHRWRRQPHDPGSPANVANQGQLNPGVMYDVDLYGADTGDILKSVPAGGSRGFSGDYVYRTNTLPRLLAGGQWGLFRVYDPGVAGNGLVPLGQLCTSDQDCDTVANTVDNCATVPNGDQINTDQPYPNSDPLGDACDPDDDNDGRADDVELSGTQCFGHITDPFLRDTDGDRHIDSWECGPGQSDPTVAGSTRRQGAGDSDGDLLLDDWEQRGWGTLIATRDTDGDGCNDGKEVADINHGGSVNSGDLLLVALQAGKRTEATDITRDGITNSGDLLAAARAFGRCAP